MLYYYYFIITLIFHIWSLCIHKHTNIYTYSWTNFNMKWIQALADSCQRRTPIPCSSEAPWCLHHPACLDQCCTPSHVCAPDHSGLGQSHNCSTFDFLIQTFILPTLFLLGTLCFRTIWPLFLSFPPLLDQNLNYIITGIIKFLQLSICLYS